MYPLLLLCKVQGTVRLTICKRYQSLSQVVFKCLRVQRRCKIWKTASEFMIDLAVRDRDALNQLSRQRMQTVAAIIIFLLSQVVKSQKLH